MNIELMYAHEYDPAECFAYMSAESVLRLLKDYIYTFIDVSYFSTLASDIAHLKRKLLDKLDKLLNDDSISQERYMQIYPHIMNLDGAFAKHNELDEVLTEQHSMSNIIMRSTLNNAHVTTYRACVAQSRQDEQYLDNYYIQNTSKDKCDKDYYIEHITRENKHADISIYKHNWCTYILYITRQNLYDLLEQYLKSAHHIHKILKDRSTYNLPHNELHFDEDHFFSRFNPKDHIATDQYNIEFMASNYRHTNLFDAIHSQILSGSEYIYAKIYYDKSTKRFEFELPEPKIYPDIVVYDNSRPISFTDAYYIMHKPSKSNSINILHKVYVHHKLCNELLNRGWLRDESGYVYNHYRDIIDETSHN